MGDIAGAPLQILIIVITAVIIRWLSVRILNRVIRRMAAQGRRERPVRPGARNVRQELSEVLMNQRRQQRAEAIGALLRSVFTATVVIIALLLILPILGINVATTGQRGACWVLLSVRRPEPGEGLPFGIFRSSRTSTAWATWSTSARPSE